MSTPNNIRNPKTGNELEPTTSSGSKSDSIKTPRSSWYSKTPLNIRLTLLTLIVISPFIFGGAYLLTGKAETYIQESSNEQLEYAHKIVSSKVSTWMDFNIRALKQTVNLPSIQSMDGESQKPILVEMAASYPYMYLVSTTDLHGVNIARNDTAEMKNYSDRTWVTDIINGSPLTLQTLIGKTSGEPALVVSIPIKNQAEDIVGVGMFASDLTAISKEVEVNTFDETGITYVIDANNQVIAHPDSNLSAELRDLSLYPPVEMLRQGKRGFITFTDEHGVTWQAYVDEIENGWAVITQQKISENKTIVAKFQRLTWLGLVLIMILLSASIWLIVRQFSTPLQELTEAARAIEKGDLTQTIERPRYDEFGILADAFNSMTSQLQQTQHGLEEQIAIRTRALETSTEVSHRLSTILDQDELAKTVVDELVSSFGYYYAHIYKFEGDDKNTLYMKGGTGEAGQTLLARGHTIQKGRGLVGRAAETNSIVLVNDTLNEEGWLPNELLPETKSEIAVPIALGEKVLGVFDVQHNELNAFSEEDTALLQSLANQIAIAAQNAQAYKATQERADREALMGKIAQEIQSTTSMEDALKVAVRELGRALDTDTSVKLD